MVINSLNEGGLMRMNKCLVFLCMMLCAICMRAQDALPVQALAQSPSAALDTLKSYGHLGAVVTIPQVALPASFKGVGENLIDDPGLQLQPFWEKLAASTVLSTVDSVRVVHVGDSHVRGHMFPRAAGESLQQVFDKLSYTDDGINGATSLTFMRPDRIDEIVSMQPDLLILSFGTNESHGRGYNPTTHYRQLTDFYQMLREVLPDVPILLTTPPGSYERTRNRRGRRVYTVNPRTQVATENILKFASEYQLAVWNMYGIFGGYDHACENWKGAQLMRPDHVHYMPDGYVLQGQSLSQALIKAYDDYVESN